MPNFAFEQLTQRIPPAIVVLSFLEQRGGGELQPVEERLVFVGVTRVGRAQLLGAVLRRVGSSMILSTGVLKSSLGVRRDPRLCTQRGDPSPPPP